MSKVDGKLSRPMQKLLRDLREPGMILEIAVGAYIKQSGTVYKRLRFVDLRTACALVRRGLLERVEGSAVCSDPEMGTWRVKGDNDGTSTVK